MARILIVEDETKIASFVDKGLRAEGHLPTIVGDGETGLDHALNGNFDLVLLDIGLPGIDGLQVLHRMRSVGSTLPVILLTARDSVDEIVSVGSIGADAYLPKPFRFADLLERIRRQLSDDRGSPNANAE